MKRLTVLLTALLLCCAAALAAEAPAYTTEARLAKNAAPLTFNVYPTDRVADDEDGFPIWRLEILDESGARAGELEFSSADDDSLMTMLNFADLNFDGYLDLIALRVMGATNAFGTVFLWDAGAGGFQPAACEEPISLFNVSLFPAQGLLMTHLHDSFATGETLLCRWEGTRLAVARRLSVLQDEDSTADQWILRALVTEPNADGTARTLLDERFERLEDENAFGEAYARWLAALWTGLDAEETPLEPLSPVYYNPNGGQHYHVNSQCGTVSAKYLPLTSLFRAELNDPDFSALTPCPACCPGE